MTATSATVTLKRCEMDRLQQELAALPGMERLSASQLRDLPWRTKERALIALFREQVSSRAVAEELQGKSRDRRLERKADKLLDDVDRDAARKKEESFRAVFMQVAAAELARLGAPALISWQKLVFDNDCCAQAFRLLLTRIKSSRRSAASGVSTNSSSLLAARYAAGGSRQGRLRESDNNAQEDNERRDWDSDCIEKESHDEPEERTRFPPLKQTEVPSRRTPATKKTGSSILSQSTSARISAGLGWNSDTTVEASPDDDESNNFVAHESTEYHPKRTTSRQPGVGISIERTLPSKQPSNFAAKFKKNQVQALQEENIVLASENAKLREEIKQMEALNAVLQNDNSNDSLLDVHPAALEFSHRRMRLLQAQNLQLQRQVHLLQDAMLAHKNAETSLMSALSHWRDVINAGREEAEAAGADQKATAEPEETGDRPSIKWMLAVPDKLVNELERVEGQIRAAAIAANASFETKLRVSNLSASFMRDEDTTLKLGEIYGRAPSSLAHLRVERVKHLEEALACVAAELDELSVQVLQHSPPKVSTIDPVHSSGYELSKSVRELVLEVGAFGVVVPTSTSTSTAAVSRISVDTASDGEHITALDVVKALSSASGVARGPAGAKEREKQAKVMLKQLHARYTAMESDVAACRREAAYWRTAWQTQDDILRRLAKRVRHLGEKKVEWCQHYLVAPMANTSEVFTSFRQAYDENTSRQNPYLPLLVETLSMEHPMLEDALQQWQEYSSSVQLKMDELVTDYEANRLLLASTPTLHHTSYNAYSDGTLPSVSEHVPVVH
ncbi:hypothetical protein PRNP1_009919 [Phytophthora ramorum]